MRLCKASPAYFLRTFGQVYDATARDWQRFDLWPAQEDALARFHQHPLTVVLKARQLGLSWLCCGWALWLMLFQPAATVLFFSQRDTEATHLLAFRLKGMLDRTPAFLQSPVIVDNAHELRLESGSTALAFPTTGGRSYTASLAIVDEADHVSGSAGTKDLDALLNAVKPTIDAGGRLILLSTADKSRPESAFKRIFRAAQDGNTTGPTAGWHPIFLPWSARPGRSPEWYEQQRADVLARTGALDDLHQEYPADPLDRRFAVEWLTACSDFGLQVEGWKVEGSHNLQLSTSGERQLAQHSTPPALPGLTIFESCKSSESRYVIGADPAEGNPQSDESAATVLDAGGRQVAVLAGRFDPAVFAAHVDALSVRYNRAAVLVERNNHGHAVILWLREFGSATLLKGYDNKPGWLQSGRGKPLCLDTAADALREQACEAKLRPTIRDRTTAEQLASIEGATLRAPMGQHDDRALAYCLALCALRFHPPTLTARPALAARPRDPIAEADRAPWRSDAW